MQALRAEHEQLRMEAIILGGTCDRASTSAPQRIVASKHSRERLYQLCICANTYHRGPKFRSKSCLPFSFILPAEGLIGDRSIAPHIR